mmetsp:Transcript_26061/g.49211  ORF Transcript_26061/g.49211 Transcript_26061/m.49211 type:complete len:212 (+) Transcript_26061:10439-11074(+)
MLQPPRPLGHGVGPAAPRIDNSETLPVVLDAHRIGAVLDGADSSVHVEASELRFVHHHFFHVPCGLRNETGRLVANIVTEAYGVSSTPLGVRKALSDLHLVNKIHTLQQVLHGLGGRVYRNVGGPLSVARVRPGQGELHPEAPANLISSRLLGKPDEAVCSVHCVVAGAKHGHVPFHGCPREGNIPAIATIHVSIAAIISRDDDISGANGR